MSWGGGLIPVTSGSSGGGAAVAIEEGDVTVLTPVSVIDFDATAFNTTTSGGTEVNVALNLGIGSGQPVDGAVFADHSARHEAAGADPIDGLLDANARVKMALNGTTVGIRRAINLIDSASVSWTVNDDSANEEVEVTATASGGGGGGGGGVNAGTLLDIARQGISLTGVVGHAGKVGGVLVTAQSSPNLTVKSAAGTGRVLGRPYIVAAIAASPAMTSHATLYKPYLISLNPSVSLTALVTTAGTNGATAADVVLPALPTGHIGLASIVITPAATTITSGMITDARTIVDHPSVVTPQMYGYVTGPTNDVAPYLTLAAADLLAFGGGYIYMPGGLGVYGWNTTFVMGMGVRLVGDGGHTRSQPGNTAVASTGTECLVMAGTAVDLIQTYTAVSGYVNPTGSTYAHGIAITGIRLLGRDLSGNQMHVGGNGVTLASLGEVHILDDLAVYGMWGHGMVAKESKTSGNATVSSTPLEFGHLSFHANGQGNSTGVDGVGAGLAIFNQIGTSVSIRYLAGDNNRQCLLYCQGNGGGSINVWDGKAERSSSDGHPAVFILKDHNGGHFGIGAGFRIRASASVGGGQAWILCRLPNAMPSIKLPMGLVEGDSGGLYTNAIESENTTQLSNVTPAQLKYMSYFGRGMRSDGYYPGGTTPVPPLQLGADVEFHYSSATPEGNIQANPGSICFRTTDSAATQLYLKRTGTGATGWASIALCLIGTAAAFNPSSVAHAAVTSTTVTVTGAALGNPCTVGFSTAFPAGVFAVADVTAANTVTVRFVNLSGATVDLASGNIKVLVQLAG